METSRRKIRHASDPCRAAPRRVSSVFILPSGAYISPRDDDTSRAPCALSVFSRIYPFNFRPRFREYSEALRATQRLFLMGNSAECFRTVIIFSFQIIRNRSRNSLLGICLIDLTVVNLPSCNYYSYINERRNYASRYIYAVYIFTILIIIFFLRNFKDIIFTRESHERACERNALSLWRRLPLRTYIRLCKWRISRARASPRHA